MKKIITLFVSLILILSSFSIELYAVNEDFEPVILDFVVTAVDDGVDGENTRASDLITSYGLNLSKSGTTLHLTGRTFCATGVVKCGFKNLTVERRKSSSYSWEDYHEFGDVYREATGAALDTTLVVPSGYQYRITCKHYAKKSLLVTQSISNASGIVTVS